MNEYFQFHSLYYKLTKGALAELDFLQLVDKHPLLYNSTILDNAIRRYECYWLPLVAKYTDFDRNSGKDPDLSLRAAPLDVAWVWHVHMLAPVAYQQDCMALFKRILNHNYKYCSDVAIGRQLWEESNYAEPFHVDLFSPLPTVPSYTSQLLYDLRSASFRQSKFYYNVALPHYKDREFLNAAVDRYKHHLHLIKTNPQLFAVPCYDFDLIWHAHQLYPLNYYNDMNALLGFVLDHDDTETGRVPGSKLYDSERITREAWAISGMPFSKRGAMYRGEPLPRVPPKPEGRFSCLVTNDFQVNLISVDAHLNPKKKLQIKITSNSGQVSLKWTVKGGDLSLGSNSTPLITFTSNSTDETSLKVSMNHKRFLNKKKLQFSKINLNEFLDSVEMSNHFPVTHGTNINFAEGNVALRFSVNTSPTPKDFQFTVVPEPTFTKVHHVAQVLSQPKLMLAPKQIEMPMLPGEMTTNQITDHRGQVVFNCKIVHSAEGMLSAVEILDIHNNLEASAHVLDVGALPEASDVSNEGKHCVTAAGKEGARAMLIRNRDDDYGICVGKWVNKIAKGRGGITKSLSFTGIKYYNLKGQVWCKVKKLKESKFLVTLSTRYGSQIDFKVDLSKGLVTIPYAGVDEIPQCLAIGFAISILHLLCRPYSPKENQLAAPVSRKTKMTHSVVSATEGTRVRRRSLSNSSLVLYSTPALLLASGYLCMTVPTNVYLMSCAGDVGYSGFCPDIDVSDGFEDMDCDGKWGDQIGFTDDYDNVNVGSTDADFKVGADDWGDGGFKEGCGGGEFGDFGDGGVFFGGESGGIFGGDGGSFFGGDGGGIFGGDGGGFFGGDGGGGFFGGDGGGFFGGGGGGFFGGGGGGGGCGGGGGGGGC